MRFNFYFILFLIFLSSCESKSNKNKTSDLIKVANLKNEEDTTTKNNMPENLNFESFLDKINKDCKFQKNSVKFPLESISLIDFENNVYDTTYIEKKDYECMKFTSPKSNIIKGKVNLKFIHTSDTEEIILLGVEDTGIHIQYFFIYKDNNWMLVKMLDEST